MSWRFRRTIRLAPGFRLNLAKRGLSLSVGRRGFTQNFGRRGARTTIGLPGSGISWSSRYRRAGAGLRLVGFIVFAIIGFWLLHLIAT